MRVQCLAVFAFVSICATAGGAQIAPLAVGNPTGAWRGLWRPDSVAPSRWVRGDSLLLTSLHWQAGQRGVSFAEIPLRGDGEAWRTRGIVVRIDPTLVEFYLDTSFTRRRDANGAVWRTARWRVQDAAQASLVALNAGQFDATLFGTLPWGWVVMNGREWQRPGLGPLSTAVVFDSLGRVSLLPPSALSIANRTSGVRAAFQSFPTLLDDDGHVPTALRSTNSGVDLTHRDARLAIGVQRDGSVLFVLTRFDAFGKTLGAVPFGLTTPEMAALMGALGCTRAVMLDGGISAQMQLRDARGTLQRWAGWRSVPMGLIVRRR
jgi:uncharacterized protein YigE (DUF2233 family)